MTFSHPLIGGLYWDMQITILSFVQRGFGKSHEHPRQGGEAFGPIKTIACWLLPYKFLFLAVAEPGGS